MPYGTGVAFEGAYVYAYDNPHQFVDLNGKRGMLSGDENLVRAFNPKADGPESDLDLPGGGFSKGDPVNTSYCNKPYPSRTRMCASFYKASAAAFWASSSLEDPGEKNACRHCVWSYLLVSQLGWADAYFFMANHEQFSESDQRVSRWRDRTRPVSQADWDREPGVIYSAVDWNNNHFGGDLGLQDTALLFRSARVTAVRKCQAALNQASLDTRALADN